jgi:hypothetical protein
MLDDATKAGEAAIPPPHRVIDTFHVDDGALRVGSRSWPIDEEAARSEGGTKGADASERDCNPEA